MSDYLQLGDLKFKPLLDEARLQQRIEEMGAALKVTYENKRPIFLCILNGSFIFTADLVRAANIECEIAFMKLSSYKGTSSTGDVKTILNLQIPIENRPVIIVEDIVDTGRTMQKLLTDLEQLKPASLEVVTLLLKPDALQYSDLVLNHVGFEISDEFVVGYGLDYNGLGRNWKQIYQAVID